MRAYWIGIIFGVLVILNAVQVLAAIGILKVLVFCLAGLSIILSATNEKDRYVQRT